MDNGAGFLLAAISIADWIRREEVLIRYGRSVWRTTEITVHPDQRLTDELALAIAASAPWLTLHLTPQVKTLA